MPRAPRVLERIAFAPPPEPSPSGPSQGGPLVPLSPARRNRRARLATADRSPRIVRTAFVATYPPRQCGIAVFTADLSRVSRDREIVALHPVEPIGPYAFEVHHRIRRNEPADYARVARSLEHCADVVSIQFEPGIWGGEDGASVLDFVHELALPATVTLHSLPVNPSARQREILVELVENVDAAIVMSDGAATLMADGYGIARERIHVIPYGVPDLPIMPPETIKPSVGLDGRDVLLSFGLLAPDKGFELMIDALPAVVAAHPKATYVILGSTHPDVRLRDGEAYRDSLGRRARSLKVADHVRLVPEFVGRVELARWLQAADVFVAPGPDLGQTVSGPLAYAMAAGRAIVATRTSYATEMLADEGGTLVDPDAASLAAAVNDLLDDPDARAAMGAVAHERSRPMIWTGVGAAYEALHARVAQEADRKIAKRGRTMTGVTR